MVIYRETRTINWIKRAYPKMGRLSSSGRGKKPVYSRHSGSDHGHA